MPPVRTKRVIGSSLRKKGFTRQSDRDHIFFFYVDDGLSSALFTKLSHGSPADEVGVGLLKRMAAQCRLELNEFLRLVDCPMAKADYRKKLVEGGHLAA